MTCSTVFVGVDCRSVPDSCSEIGYSCCQYFILSEIRDFIVSKVSLISFGRDPVEIILFDKLNRPILM